MSIFYGDFVGLKKTSKTENNLSSKFDDHKLFMQTALDLAQNGWGKVFPNPLVGALVVKNKKIIGQGWHMGPGSDHAEVMAIKNAGEKASGATLYVNLEPCNHYGKTPPCTLAIKEAKIKKVFYALKDPNPKAKGGAEELKQDGLDVFFGLLNKEAQELNAPFLKWQEKKLPFVILKTALSLDGKIATSSFDSKWITSSFSRQCVHQLRAGVQAIMVGRKTALLDNPLLTARLDTNQLDTEIETPQPWRIILDSKLSLPIDLNVFNSKTGGQTVVVCSHGFDQEKKSKLESFGHLVWFLPNEKGQVNLKALMEKLGAKKIQSLLIEAGGTLAFSALAEYKIIDLIHYFIAPKIIGGFKAPGAVDGQGLSKVSLALNLEFLKINHLNDDIHIVARTKSCQF